MPEIGEIARLVHYLRKHLVGKTISSVKVQEDKIVYGGAGTTATQFQEAIARKKVLDAQQQGKYFWLVMSSPPHPLLHASMTGWIRFSNDDSSFYKPSNNEDTSWPPKYWKFILATDEETPCEAAFVDPRRLGRIRLLDCAGDAIRQTQPLIANGPDPVQDKAILTKEWFTKKVRSKKMPVKAFLLDQSNISGVGNWVGDEILFHAKIHPEQSTQDLSDAKLDQLHQSLLHVCDIAVETLADQDKFPKDWLMKYRWGKGKRTINQLPTGEKIEHLKVGGRTSAFVPSLQKKTAPVAQAMAKENSNSSPKDDFQSKVGGKAKRKREMSSKTGETDPVVTKDNKASPTNRGKRTKVQEGDSIREPPAPKSSPDQSHTAKVMKSGMEHGDSSVRRSTRLRKKPN